MRDLVITSVLLAGLTSTVWAQVKPLESIKVAKAPYFSALSPDGTKLFITGFADSEIQVVDLASRKATTRFYGG